MKWYMDKDYMKQHLKGYVEFQLRQGYQLKDITAALLKYGYDPLLVEEIKTKVDPGHFKPVKNKKPSIKELNEDLYIYLQDLLVDYIKKEQSQGYTVDVIKKALINYGHHPAMVKQAISAVQNGKIIDREPSIKLPPSLMILFSVACIFIFIFYMAFATEAALNIIFMSFSPCLIATLLVYAIFINTDNKNIIQVLPVVSVGIVVLLFIGALKISPIFRSISEPATVLLLNAVLGFITGLMISVLSRPRPKRISVEDIVETAPVPIPNEDRLAKSIEKELHTKPKYQPSNKKNKLKIKDF